MAAIFNECTVTAEPSGRGATRQRLLTETRLPGSGILLDRLALGPGGEARLTVKATSVAWLQVLDGRSAAGARRHKPDAVGCPKTVRCQCRISAARFFRCVERRAR